MLGEVEKKKKALYWCVSQLFLKYPHIEVPLTMTIGQHQQQARNPALLLEYSRSGEGFGATLQDPCQPVGLRLPGAHKAMMLRHHPLSSTIRHWWVGREGRWTEGQTEKIVAVAHLDPAPLWRSCWICPVPRSGK